MSPRLRRFVAGCSLASFCLLLIGLPVPRPIQMDAARPFPCQHHACGCFDADACLANCCCFTHAEKAAWADERGLALPELAAPPAGPADPVAAEPKAECCSTRGCDDATIEHVGPENQTPQPSNGRPASPPGEPKSPLVVVWGARTLQCQGGAALWLTIGPSLVPPPVFELSLEWEVVGRIVLCDDELPEIGAGLASPPPELG